MDQKTLKQLKEIINSSLKDVTKKNDLKTFATKDDLKTLITKDDLVMFGERLREEITEDVSSVVNELVQTIDERKADKSELLLLDARVRVLEDKRN